MKDFTIRNAHAEDLTQIVAIYNAAIPARLATGDLIPVSVESREPWFKAHRPDKYPLIVAEDATGEIMGWGSLNAFYGRAAYIYTAEISIYVAPAHSRKGLGNALVDELIARAPALEIKTMLAFIFGHNDPSLKLFARKGFKPWGTLPRIADLDGHERNLDILGLRIMP